MKSSKEILSKYTASQLKGLVKAELDRAGISYEEGNFEEGKIDFKLNPPTAEEYTKWMEEYFNRK